MDESLETRLLGAKIEEIMNSELRENIVRHSIAIQELRQVLVHASISLLYPLETIYIYCTPCPVHINTAIAICKSASTREIQFRVRVDCRLPTNCCENISGVPSWRMRTGVVQNLLSRIKEAEYNCRFPPSGRRREHLQTLLTKLDLSWIMQTLRRGFQAECNSVNADNILGMHIRDDFDDASPRFAVFMLDAALANEFMSNYYDNRPASLDEGQLYEISDGWKYITRFTFKAPSR